MKNSARSLIALMTAAALTTSLAACQNTEVRAEEKGPAQKAGEHIDKALTKAGDGINRAAEATGNGLNKAADATGKALQKAGEKLQGAANNVQKQD
ncbi:hypothetical protein D3870_10970 [Noviherbaspirillum cavernae]|uniref:Apolipophorin n=1 Tax=Noviherbaspirillum cavernae TaxID=2320862 RepID=A0A418X1Y8_9BURK|nr:hypothetical protein [Noviherbaspirillum cavernae]RJG06464.1 hypothetical protein D3870_10970 [Noviherbaspirillum cavernae]